MKTGSVQMEVFLADMLSTEHSECVIIFITQAYHIPNITIYESQQHNILLYSKMPKYWKL